MTLIDHLRLSALGTITLRSGAHDNPDAGMCMVEAAAWIAGEPFSDHPACVSPVIAAFCRSWNDHLEDTDRNRLLKPLVPKIVGTAASADVEDARAWMCFDWLVRTYTPTWLRLAGLDVQADLLANLAEFRPGMDVPSVRHTLEAARTDAAAAWAAAGVPVWDAAGDAAWDAAWVAAGVAAWAAAGVAVGAATWVAVWDAVGDAAGDAASAAARVAAGATTGVAASAAAKDALAPAVTELQTSAVALIEAMCGVGHG